MTTTTRTTRKAPWAAVLTALLAVLALVFGAMAFAGVANAQVGADQPDDPGKSETAPGHDGTAPGLVEDGTPGNSDGTPGGGNDNNNPNDLKKVWVCHADTNNGNGQPNLGQGGTGGENKTGFNILYISVNAWENGHEGRHPEDSKWLTEAEALAECGPETPIPDKCPSGSNHPDVTLDGPYNAAEDYAKCYDSVTQTVKATLCDLNAVPPTMVEFPDITAMAYTDALKDAQATTHVRYALTCPITADQAAAIDAAIATTVPEPATVTEEPETVAVPAPAKVAVPAAVPAGDGSTVPQVPVALLALLALATAAAVTSGLRMATTR